MKKAIILFGILLLAGAFSFAQEDTITKTNYEFRKVNQNSFGLGEKLNFTINYVGVKAGDAIMEVAPYLVNINGRDCYKINITVRTSSSFEWVYKLDEKYECNLDAQGFFPWRYNSDKTQGKYKEQFEAIFDQENHKVKTFEGYLNTFKKEVTIPEYIQDQVSAFYYARTFDIPNLNAWDLITTFQVFDKEQAKPLEVKYLGREEVSVDAGKFKCIKVKPMGMEGGLFGASDDLVIWLTDDVVKMPVKIEIKIKVGSFNVDLDSYQNVKTLNSKLD
jgi:hypothetical protein